MRVCCDSPRAGDGAAHATRSGATDGSGSGGDRATSPMERVSRRASQESLRPHRPRQRAQKARPFAAHVAAHVPCHTHMAHSTRAVRRTRSGREPVPLSCPRSPSLLAAPAAVAAAPRWLWAAARATAPPRTRAAAAARAAAPAATTQPTATARVARKTAATARTATALPWHLRWRRRSLLRAAPAAVRFAEVGSGSGLRRTGPTCAHCHIEAACPCGFCTSRAVGLGSPLCRVPILPAGRNSLMGQAKRSDGGQCHDGHSNASVGAGSLRAGSAAGRPNSGGARGPPASGSGGPLNLTQPSASAALLGFTAPRMSNAFARRHGLNPRDNPMVNLQKIALQSHAVQHPQHHQQQQQQVRWKLPAAASSVSSCSGPPCASSARHKSAPSRPHPTPPYAAAS
jgi:hypothetical protein